MSTDLLQQDLPICTYSSGDALRSRTVSRVVRAGTVNVPEPPARLVADWQRDVALHLGLEIGDVDVLPWARTRARWAGFNPCLQAASDWMITCGMHATLLQSEMALMACRAARYHHDGLQYGANAFCNLFLSEDKGLDLHFPALQLRIPLQRGTVVVFDTCQPHAVIPRDKSDFQASHFRPDEDCTQVFLTWELPIEDDIIAKQLGITFDGTADMAQRAGEEQVSVAGTVATVCPQTGQWQRLCN